MIAGADARRRRPTVLVLRALGLGDLCCAVPALRALRRAYPDHELVLAAPRWQEPLARAAGVERVVGIGELEPVPAAAHGADVAVNLHGSGPQSTRLLADTGPAHLVAFHHPDAGVPLERTVAWDDEEHEVRRWCRLLEAFGIAADPSELRLAPPRVAPAIAPGTAVIHPGAAAPGRRWPAERFGEVAAALVDRGMAVALTGTADERPLCDRVADAAGRERRRAIAVLAGETDVVELAATIADAVVLVANDTGVAHLASAYGTPSVVLFGPTPPSEWGPPPTGPHRALWAGRRGDPHAETLDPGLAAIGVAEVLDALEEVAPRVPA